MNSRLLALLGAVVCSLTSTNAIAQDLANVRVLVCHGYFDLLNIPAVKRLEAAGAQVRAGNLSELTWETARQYHLIIAIAQDPKDVSAPAALAQFVKAGGGLVFFRNFYGGEKADAYLEPFDASMPYELIQDPAHTYRCPTGWRLPYAYADRITTNHPVTDGVRAIWYPAGDRFYFHTSPLKVAEPWKVLVSASDQARSIQIGGLHEEEQIAPGAFASAPPVIAAREYGAGAVVLLGLSPMEVFLGQGLPAYQDIALEKGDGLRPSDLRQLYENALRWLAGYARKSTEIGQGELAPLVNEWAKPSLVDWSQDVFGGDLCTQPARGVIGVHSNLSDGRAAPGTLIEKAKALGLQWVAFTERLEKFSPEKWEQLRKICGEASTPEFAALPGLDYQDGAGARYVVFGDFDWPPEKVFSEDRQRIVIPQWWFNIGVAPNGPYDLGHSPLRSWDYSMYDRVAVRTTIAGRLVDEAREAFGRMQGVMDDPFPMAVEMCHDETELEAAAGRMANFVTQNQVGDLAKFYRGLSYYGSYRGFVSDGPLVTDWRARNETRITGGKWWLPGTEQYRVKLAVQSAAPIKEIRIYDGPRLFRRICPPGRPEGDQAGAEEPLAGARGYNLIQESAAGRHQVTLTLDLPHDQQRNLFAEITDADGKHALTGGLFIRDFLNWRFMCSDRGNSICDAVQVDEYGAYLTGPTAPYQRKMTVFGAFPGYGERHFNILPPDFDGGMRPVGMQVMPRIQAEGFTLAPPEATLESRMEVPVCSRDGLLQEETVTGYFPCAANAWERKCAPADVEGVRIRYRYLDLTPRAHDPGVLLLEGSIQFEKAMTVNAVTVFSVFPTSQPGEVDHYALMTPTVRVAGLVAPQPFNASAPMVPGSYACVFPSAWGSSGAMALDEGYTAHLYSRAPSNSIQITLDGMPRKVSAGEEIRYRLALIQGSLRAAPNTAEWERFAQAMGFRGPPAYEVKDVRAGTLKGTRFLLEVEPSENGFAGTITQADLPVRLPVRVADMNPNWTFAWFDLDRKEWHPSAVDALINQGYFSLDTRRGAHRIFAGHPVLADHPEVRIAVLSDAKSEVRATVNNPGDQKLQLTVRLNPALGAAPAQNIELAPGEIQSLTFPLAAP